jgi:glycosyltransferase involved in cell wall biosynthesis
MPVSSYRKKILFLSDAVSASSGLGRITRDLAQRVHEHMSDVYEVATCGYGGNGSIKYPWQQYHLHDIKDWLVPELPAVWADFVGDEEGILCAVWDMSRLYWLGNPQTCPMPHLRRWVETAKMKKWAYHAVDAEGPNGKFPGRIAETMKGFDRVLDYSAFSSKITGNPDHLPHGIDTSVFYPRDHRQARRVVMESGFQGLKEDSLLIGIVATNQARKNWQLGIETCKILLDRGHDVRLWAHTDVLDRYWSIGNLIVDYGLQGRVAVTTHRFTDDQMCHMYSACNCTLGIAPEGWGYPICESLTCGVPVITGNYAAQAEYVPKKYLVDPIAFFYEGAFCSKRPVFNPSDWADKAESAYLESSQVARKSILPEWIDWKNAWKEWEKWFRVRL